MSERRDLRRALARDDLHLHYQPIVQPRTGEVVSAEALLRGKTEDRRDWNIAGVTAGAEKGSEIFDLDRWMIQQAFRDAARWQSAGLEGVALNLNVSTREFQNNDFLETLDRVAGETAIDPRRVILEITETASIHDPKRAEKVVNHLQQRGHEIWLDDFGTGHSSLAWLKWFPVNGLKIPSLFVCDLVSDARCRQIVFGIFALAKGLGVTVVAEGVENEEQLRLLLENEVDLVQGFFFYKAMSVKDLQSAVAGKEAG